VSGASVRRADQVAGLVLLALAIGYTVVALRAYPYWGATGPGSGFLPVWLGVAMGILALLLFIGASRAGTPGARWLPERGGLLKLGWVLAATVLFAALLDVVGMVLGSGLFLIGILHFLEGYRWLPSLGIAAATALVNYVVFTYWLQVPFPVSVLGF
jgi:hypothetical protein